jgi:3-hydroxybutyryl-CoA dehydrogenase
MVIVVFATDDEQWNALTANSVGVNWIKGSNDFNCTHYPDADAFFLLNDIDAFDFLQTKKTVFINSVIDTLASLNTPPNVVRINGWHGFLQKNVWEIAGTVDENSKAICTALSKKISQVKDEPGMVAAKIIAMIINEAYIALAEEVSTKSEIDTAMKLGTNYPYGPFEWAEKIGIKNIYLLLQKLSLTDKRCLPAVELAKAATPNTL